ncbi:hypothetical protein ACFFLM_01905 [Deinococcus oregonensis]|uniref:Uncharacterized protein n=1 Tax=Deinococcus oregonensis TaxID=1805970 RepID=A0ABV6AX43_9DEIO
MTSPSPSPGTPGERPEQQRLGIAFALAGVDELTFTRILRDLMHDPAFRRPLQVQAEEPRPGHSARLTLAFLPVDREVALNAMQRLKTLLLRYGVQVDSIVVPGEQES